MTERDLVSAAREWQWTTLALVSIGCVLSLFVQVGADWDWLVALGDHIRRTGSVPDGVPFAAADTAGWHNVPVLAEVVASMLHDRGPWSVGAAHLVLAILGLVALAGSARSGGASDRVVAAGLVLLVAGSLSTWALIRVQSWSLLFFPLLLALLAQQARRPDRRIWWGPVLIALWANLHGAVLLGVCVLGAYLLFSRLRQRPGETVAVGVASVLAVCLTPQLWMTPWYYVGVLTNVSATRRVGLWAAPTWSDGFDVALLSAGLALLVMVAKRRRALWEYVAILGLVGSTVTGSRHGVWLLCLLVVLLPDPQAQGRPADDLGGRGSALSEGRAGRTIAAVVALASAMPIAVARGDVHVSDQRVLDSVERVADGGVVLAPAPVVEALAVDGVEVWVGNPLDAFTLNDQAAYLDFLAGDAGMEPAVKASDVVVVRTDSRTGERLAAMTGFAAVSCGPGWTCFIRR